MGFSGKNTGMSCPFLLQWTVFCQNFSLWLIHLGWLHGMFHSFIQLCKPRHHDKAMILEGDILGSVQFSSVAQSCPTLCDPMNRSTPGLPVHHLSRSSLRLTAIESVMPSSHLIFGHPLLLLPPIPPSIRVVSNESTLHMRWPKYWIFSFSIIPSKFLHRGLLLFF